MRARLSKPPATLPVALAFIVLFLGGGAAGLALAHAFAPDSWAAEAVSFFALPFAFAFGLQAWYGLALLGLLRLLLGRAWGARPKDPIAAERLVLPGSWVFLPFSSAAGALAGAAVGILAPGPAWPALLAYWAAGTAHGLLAWRLARRGYLPLPETV